MNNFGLLPKEYQIISRILEKYLLSSQSVVVYGSRAKGNYKETSDIDLVIKGDYKKDIIGNLLDEIDESNFPYLCDISYFEKITSQNLKEHINRVGKVFYEKS